MAKAAIINSFRTSLDGAINDTDLSATLLARIPAADGVTAGDYVWMWAGAELIRLTIPSPTSGLTFVISRGHDGTTATAHADGTPVIVAWTREALTQLRTDATAAATATSFQIANNLSEGVAATMRTNLALGSVSTLNVDTDGTLAANSDTLIASQKAVRTYVGAYIAAQDVEAFKGSIDCSANPNYPAADAGNVYRVSVAGKIGGASGPSVEQNDRLECITDSSSAGTHGAVGANWFITQANIDGAVIGPASVTDSHFAQFDGTTGKLIKGGLALDATTTLGTSNTKVPSQNAVKVYVDTAVSGFGSGSVTSVACTVPSGFTVAGSPITTTGTLAITLDSQAASKFLVSPSGSSGSPTFRVMAAADLPMVTTAKGGTGIDTSGVTDGQILMGTTSGHTWSLGTLTAGYMASITNAAGAITVAVATPFTTDVDGSTVTFDLATSNTHRVTLTASRTLALANAGSGGKKFFIELIEDGTGGWTPTWWSGITWKTIGGGAPTVNTDPAAVNVYMFICTGSGTYLGWDLTPVDPGTAAALDIDSDPTLPTDDDLHVPTVDAVRDYIDTTSQPLDATLTALAGNNWATNSLAIGSGTDTVAQVTFAANTFPARASSAGLVAKTITDFGLSMVDDTNATALLATIGVSAVATDGQIIIGKTSDHSFNVATLTAGYMVTVTNGAGAITLALTAAITAEADGSTITFDLVSNNTHAPAALGGNRTLAVSNAGTGGKKFVVILTQDGTGGRTVTWWSGITWRTTGGAVPTLSVAPGGQDVFTFICTGSGTYLGFVN